MTRRSLLAPGIDHQQPIRATWRQVVAVWGIFAAILAVPVAVGLLIGWN